jgi:hypothetical protein
MVVACPGAEKQIKATPLLQILKDLTPAQAGIMVENNFLSSKDVVNLHKELEEADKTGADKHDIYE